MDNTYRRYPNVAYQKTSLQAWNTASIRVFALYVTWHCCGNKRKRCCFECWLLTIPFVQTGLPEDNKFSIWAILTP